MENMRAVDMDVYTLYILSIYVPGNIWAFIHHKNGFSFFLCFVRENRSKEPRAYY